MEKLRISSRSRRAPPREGGGGRGTAWCRAALLLLLLPLLFLPAAPAAALDPGFQISQYGHTAWRVRDGFFGGALYSLAQTPDGFLWIGTDTGLFRFDGVRFWKWQPPEGQALPDERVFVLLAARDGSLWIGTGFGLAQWRDGVLTVHADAGRFTSLTEDRDGTVWAGRTRVPPPLCRYRDGAFACFDPAAPELGKFVGALYEDRGGQLWVGGEKGVCRWRAEAPQCHGIESLHGGARGIFGVFVLGEDAGGNLLADAGPTGLWRLVGRTWQPFLAAAGVPLRASKLLLDRQGSLFVGSTGRGLRRLKAGRTESFGLADGLTGDTVSDLLEDREGNLWVATTAGLDRFRDLKVATLTAREGLEGSYFLGVAAARGGGVWATENRSLLRLDAAGIVSTRAGQGLPGDRPTSLLEDSRGRLWLGVDDGLWSLEDGRFTEIRPPDGGKAGIVTSLAEDRDGDLWVAVVSPRRLLLRLRGGRVVEERSAEQLATKTVTALAADPEGGVWVGLRAGELLRCRAGATISRSSLGLEIHSLLPGPAGGLWVVSESGLHLWRGARLDTLDVAHGLPCEDLDSVLAEPDGSLWLKASCGLTGIAAAEVAAWLKDPQKKVAVRLRDARDGVLTGRSAFTPLAARARDGRLYFAIGEGGLQVFDPARESLNRVPPPVAILRLVADGREYPEAGGRRLPALTREVEIDYAALSFTDPEKVRFRYRLEEDGGGWREVGNRREAYFSSLAPGSYTFEVKACNNDGVWNEQGAAIPFTVLPAFYQTNVFRLLCGLALAAGVWALYRWRVRAFAAGLERQAEERLAERTLIARELHDTLLQGVLSSSMHLHVALAQLPPEAPVAPALHRVQQILAQVGDEGRSVLSGLRSSDRGADDLELALRRVPGELAQASGDILFLVKATGPARPLRPTVRDDAYRIAREALTNAYRHAGARVVEVEIEYAARELRIAVRDDGRGIGEGLLRTGRKNHWGLAGMRERASRIGARLSVEGSEGAGTAVELRVPAAVAYEGGAAGWWRGKLGNSWRRLLPRRRPAAEEGPTT